MNPKSETRIGKSEIHHEGDTKDTKTTTEQTEYTEEEQR
jgi:hypothetical protein